MVKKKVPELKIEVINSQGNFIFLALVEYKREEYLCIIDNIQPSEIGVYVLDYADQESIDIRKLLSLATYWFYSRSDDVPFSVYMAREGLTNWASPIYRMFDATYVSRIIGQSFEYGGMTKSKVKRRRVIPIPEGIEIRLKR